MFICHYSSLKYTQQNTKQDIEQHCAENLYMLFNSLIYGYMFQLQPRLSQSNPSPKVMSISSCLCNHLSRHILVQNAVFLEVDRDTSAFQGKGLGLPHWPQVASIRSIINTCLVFCSFTFPVFFSLPPSLSIWKNRRLWYEEAVSCTHTAKPHTCAKLFTINSCLTFSVCEFCVLWAAVELNFNREGGG